jgi:hypothetical protein
MKSYYTFGLLVSMIVLLLGGCAPAATAVPTAQVNPADRFAGAWSGSMSFSNRDGTEDIFVTIPSGCVAGEPCGEIFNSAVNCTWEVRLEAVNGDVFDYTFSKTLSGECPAIGNGSLTLQEDGTLVREHVTPDFTATGILGRRAEGYKPMYGFAGTWSGAMSSSENPDRKYDIEIHVPITCKAGNNCGSLTNFSGECGVAMILISVNGGIFEYDFATNTIVECPYGGSGTLTLQPDGSLIMEHVSPNQTMSAVLSRR